MEKFFSPSDVRIVLVRTSHPGNIGSAARAMKTMGMNELYLVAPEKPIDDMSRAMSAGGLDVLEHAVVCDSLGEALRGCHTAIGTSARERTFDRKLLRPWEAASVCKRSQAEGKKAAIVFGCERTGLTNDELELCGSHVIIPSVAEYSSLNLAMAVQVCCYELRKLEVAGSLAGNSESADIVAAEPANVMHPGDEPADGEKLEGFYGHLSKTLSSIGFLRGGDSSPVMRKIRRIFSRPYLSSDDVNILRGILSLIDKSNGERNE